MKNVIRELKAEEARLAKAMRVVERLLSQVGEPSEVAKPKGRKPGPKPQAAPKKPRKQRSDKGVARKAKGKPGPKPRVPKPTDDDTDLEAKRRKKLQESLKNAELSS